MLATQVVISMGWELFHGTAALMTKPEDEKPLDTQPDPMMRLAGQLFKKDGQLTIFGFHLEKN